MNDDLESLATQVSTCSHLLVPHGLSSNEGPLGVLGGEEDECLLFILAPNLTSNRSLYLFFFPYTRFVGYSVSLPQHHRR